MCIHLVNLSGQRHNADVRRGLYNELLHIVKITAAYIEVVAARTEKT